MLAGSLFSGIGGLDLAVEAVTGARTVWQVERDEWCRGVLAQHWPEAQRFDDVCSVGEELERVDIIAGGFPCQDVSLAGKRAGLAGERSGLWSEFARIVRVVRPRFVLVENVAGLLSMEFGQVLGDLAALGFDAEWHCLPAAAIGARHRRDRVWIVAYPNRHASARSEGAARIQRSILAEAGWEEASNRSQAFRDRPVHVSHAMRHRLERRIEAWAAAGAAGRSCDAGGTGWWATEPDVGRVADGVPARTHRLRALGNAIVPQIAQIITETLNDVDTR